MEMTINLQPEFEVQARGLAVTVDMAQLSENVIAQAVLHGLKQTVADAASNAAGSAYDGARKESEPHWKDMDARQKKSWAVDHAQMVADEAFALMQKRVDALQEGDWTTRANAAPGMSKFESYVAEIVAGHMTFAKGTRKPEKLQAALEKYHAQPEATRRKIADMAHDQIKADEEKDAIELDLSL